VDAKTISKPNQISITESTFKKEGGSSGMIDELDENLTASRNQNIESPKFKMNIVLQHKTLGKFVSA